MKIKKQKFLRGQRVKVGDMPKWMSHFPHNCEAIVVGSSRDLGCGYIDRTHEYELLILNKDGKPRDTSAWYDEYQLTLVNEDREDGEKILQKYNEEEDED